jgi:hypothetical protein
VGEGPLLKGIVGAGHAVKPSNGPFGTPIYYASNGGWAPVAANSCEASREQQRQLWD